MATTASTTTTGTMTMVLRRAIEVSRAVSQTFACPSRTTTTRNNAPPTANSDRRSRRRRSLQRGRSRGAVT